MLVFIRIRFFYRMVIKGIIIYSELFRIKLDLGMIIIFLGFYNYYRTGEGNIKGFVY